MPLWKLTLAYDGTSFYGWQIQPDLPTIQGTLATALYRITGETVLPQGSGRTDAGVHALAQVASFSLEGPIPEPNLLRALNHALPPSIRVLSAEHAHPNFHARHSACRKTYEYRIFPRIPADRMQPDHICPPTLAPYVWDCQWPLSLPAAQQAASYILGEHDFRSFASADPDLATRNSIKESPTVRRIFQSCWQLRANLLIYQVTGSGFLHHMVRNLVGTFVDVAAGRISTDAIPRILEALDRSAAGPTAPARGLFLAHVDYQNQPDLPLTQIEETIKEAEHTRGEIEQSL